MAFLFHTGVSGVGGDFVVFPDAADIQNIWDGGCTLMAWIDFATFGQGGSSRLFDKKAPGNADGWTFFIDDTLDRIGLFVVFSGTNGSWRSGDNTISTGTRLHVAVTYDADSAANDPIFYVDGVSAGFTQSANPSGTRNSDVGTDMYIGQRAEYTQAFDGTMGDARAFSRILTADEILTAYTANGGDSIITGQILRHPMSPVKDGIGISSPWVDGTEDSADSTQVVADVPTHLDDDLLVLSVCASGDTTGVPPNITTPSGWTQRLHFDFPSTVSTPTLAVYTRIASSEPATYTITNDQTCALVSFMQSFRGIASEVPDTTATGTGTTASPISPTVTPSANALVLRIAGMDSVTQEPTIRGSFFPTNMSGRRVLSQNGADTDGITVGIAEELHDATATGTRTWNGAGSDQWGAATLAWLYGDGIEGPTAKDTSANANHRHTWHQITGAEDSLKIGGC